MFLGLQWRKQVPIADKLGWFKLKETDINDSDIEIWSACDVTGFQVNGSYSNRKPNYWTTKQQYSQAWSMNSSNL